MGCMKWALQRDSLFLNRLQEKASFGERMGYNWSPSGSCTMWKKRPGSYHDPYLTERWETEAGQQTDSKAFAWDKSNQIP